MDQQLVASMEQMLLATFPPLETAEADGVIVGSSHGVTGRANAAVVIGAVHETEATVQWACEWLSDRERAPLFRISPLAPPEIVQLLGPDNAYNRTSCMHLALGTDTGAADHRVAITAARPDDWISEGDDRRKAEVAALMENVDGEIAWAMIRDDGPGRGAPVAAGRGVVVDEWLCIQAMYTEPDARGRGLATAILRALHAWAIQAGADQAFLNVLATNRTAQSIYARHGYRHVYDYSYVSTDIGAVAAPQDC